MTELIIKMLICLLGAFIIGFIFGYLISKVFGKKKHIKEVEDLQTLLSSEEKKNALLKDELSTVKNRSDTQTLKLTEKEKELESHVNTIKELNKLFKQKDKNNILLQEKLLQAEETFSEQALMLSEAEGEIKRHAIVVKDLNTVIEQLEQENVLLTTELTEIKKSKKEINKVQDSHSLLGEEHTIKQSETPNVEIPKIEEDNRVQNIAIAGGVLGGIKGVFDKVTNTDVEVPEVKVPDVKAPDVDTPDLDVEVPEVEIPNIKTPEVETPEVKVPDVDTPNLDIEVPQTDIKTHDVEKKKEERIIGKVSLAGGAIAAAKDILNKVTEKINIPGLNEDDTKAVETYRDNLQDIKGIDEKLETQLNDIGIYNFEQISKWSSEDIQAIKEKILFNIDIEDEDWIEQAKLLIKDRDK